MFGAGNVLLGASQYASDFGITQSGLLTHLRKICLVFSGSIIGMAMVHALPNVDLPRL
jgi:hypothetical protein